MITRRKHRPQGLTHIEAMFELLRDEGIDPAAIEENLLPHCICGKPQAIVAIGIPVLGVIRVTARCTQPDRKRCRVSKRLRLYKFEVSDK